MKDTLYSIITNMEKDPSHGGARAGAGRPKAKNPRKMISVRVSDATHKKLDDLTQHYGYSKGRIIEKVIRDHKPE